MQNHLEKIELTDSPFYTIQGEGKYIGYPTMFMRFWGCNLHCTWCDTKYSWETRENTVFYTIEEIITIIEKSKVKIVVITGGEPILRYKTIAELAQRMPENIFQIETNGTLPILPLQKFKNIHFVVSPKLLSSGNTFEYKSEISKQYLESNADWKFVATENSIKEIFSFMALHKIPKENVYLMPKGTTNEEIIENSKYLWKVCLDYGIKLTTRLHVLLLGNGRLI